MLTERMHIARGKIRISQAELARRLGVSPGAVGNWESGTRSPDAEMLSRIADALGCTVDYLLGREEMPEKPSATDDDLKVALFGGNGKVTDEMWEEVKQFAEFVKKRKRQQ